MTSGNKVKHVIRPETLFAGIRKPIKSREELGARIEKVKQACGNEIAGPLVHIFRFDTPVDGYDSEIGFPVSAEVSADQVCTHTLRELHFFSLMHNGPVETLRNTTRKIVEQMHRVGLSQELELVEIYHNYDLENPDDNVIETRVAFLAWPEVYKEQLLRVLGAELTTEIRAGGEAITPFTPVG